jgi:hypothetical protein
MEKPLNKNSTSTKLQKFHRILVLLIGGGLVFWITTIIISLLPIAAEYRAAYSKASIQSVWIGSLFAGLIIGFCVTCILVKFSQIFPTKFPILTSVIISFVALAIATALILIPQTNSGTNISMHYFLIGILLDLPRFLFLGIVIGFLYKKVFN